MKQKERLQIVATLGPASHALAGTLRSAGATAFRLNASHLTVEELGRLAVAVRAEVPGSPLVIDLRGAKMRLGRFAEAPVHAGENVRFSLSGLRGTIPLPHPEIFTAIAAGETLGCDDDRLQFRVISVNAGSLDALALSDGTMRSRKGVNILEHPVILQDLGEEDQASIRAVVGLDRTAFAFSFMKDGSEAEWIRRRAPGCRVIGKIERREATAGAARIASSVDELWICRGDLGAQLGPAPMARWISSYDPRSVQRPVLMAGQVLEQLTHHTLPTRAEVCHLFDLVGRGYAGFVLSDETAIGVDPAGAVRTLNALLAEFCDIV